MQLILSGFTTCQVTINRTTNNSDGFDDDEMMGDISELESLSYAVYKSLGCPLGNTSVGFRAWIDKQNTEYQDFCDRNSEGI